MARGRSWLCVVMPTFDTPLNSVAATGEHLVRWADATPARAGALPNGTASNQPDTRSSPTDGFPLSCGRRDGWTSMSRTWRGPPGPRTQFVRERIAEGDWERRAYIYDWRPLECCVDNGVHNMAAVTGCRGLKKSVSSGRQGIHAELKDGKLTDAATWASGGNRPVSNRRRQRPSGKRGNWRKTGRSGYPASGSRRVECPGAKAVAPYTTTRVCPPVTF